MAHSIEARVPFLDHRLVEFAFRLPADYKMRGVETKSVLREAMRGMLPEPIRTRRDKIGFRAEPAVTWDWPRATGSARSRTAPSYEERWLDRAALAALLDGERSDRRRVHALARAQHEALAATFWGDRDDLSMIMRCPSIRVRMETVSTLPSSNAKALMMCRCSGSDIERKNIRA